MTTEMIERLVVGRLDCAMANIREKVQAARCNGWPPVTDACDIGIVYAYHQIKDELTGPTRTHIERAMFEMRDLVEVKQFQPREQAA